MIRSSYKYEEIVSPAERDDMICFVSLEHESRLENTETRATHFSLCMDVKLKFEVLASSKDCPIQMMKQLTSRSMASNSIPRATPSGRMTVVVPWSISSIRRVMHRRNPMDAVS